MKRLALEECYHLEDRGARTECWIWHAGKVKGNGGRLYGKMRHPITRRDALAHRVSYEAHHGPIPPGYVVDHICRQTLCVNPWHLEAKTQSANIRRAVRNVAAYRKHNVIVKEGAEDVHQAGSEQAHEKATRAVAAA